MVVAVRGAIAAVENEKVRICIFSDDGPPNPREEFDNLGTIIGWSDRYVIGDDNPHRSAAEFLVSLVEEHLPFQEEMGLDLYDLDLEELEEAVEELAVPV
ncbi:MAG: hypothetical protein Q8R28_06040, partial [Dehalococcoidia bacterium]|nr:hypothetical protein [Dehalococcoidia bacterium]